MVMMKRTVVFICVLLFTLNLVAGKRHRKPTSKSKKSTIPKAPQSKTLLHVSRNLPWKEISKKSLISNGFEQNESMQKQKRGFLTNLANLLNDAASIADHKDVDNKATLTSEEPHQKSSIKQSVHDKPTPQVVVSDKKDVIDLATIKDSIKAEPDFAPIFTMYHGKLVELGKVPETAFKKSHLSQDAEADVKVPEHHIKDVTASKRVLEETKTTTQPQHAVTEVAPTRREFHSSDTDNPAAEPKASLDGAAKSTAQLARANSVTKDTISMPSIDSTVRGGGDLINHVKSVVLDDGKIISVGSNNHLLDNIDQSNKVQQQAELISDVQQKFVVGKEGNVEPLAKQKSETADAVPRDNLENGQKTVTLTVDVLKQLLKKTDSKVSLAQLLNKPSESPSDQRSNTQEDEDPGTIEDFAAGGLKAHNSYRVKHHDDNLIWSDSLAAKAQKLAEALADRKSLEIAKDLEKEGMGENVAKVWATFKNAGEAATKMWYSQSGNYHFDDPHLDENTGQFAQVVWKSTKELGMGVAKSIDDVNNKYVYVTALYSPPGNIEAVLRENVLPTGNATQDVYATFFKRTGVMNHTSVVVRRSKVPRSKKSKKVINP